MTNAMAPVTLAAQWRRGKAHAIVPQRCWECTSSSAPVQYEPAIRITLLMGIARRMALKTTYQFLEPRAESNYRQLFVRGRSLRAEILYRATIGAEPRTPEEVAADFGVPLAAVHEAVHYCLHNEELLRQEREAVLADIRARGLDKPPYIPIDGTPRA